MSVKLYVDHHVRRAIADELRRRGIDVLTAEADGASRLDDSGLLDRATKLGRVLFSQDHDLLREAARRQETGEPFAGVIYAHQLKATIRQCIDGLELIAKVGEPEDFAGRVEYLPLK